MASHAHIARPRRPPTSPAVRMQFQPPGSSFPSPHRRLFSGALSPLVHASWPDAQIRRPPHYQQRDALPLRAPSHLTNCRIGIRVRVVYRMAKSRFLWHSPVGWNRNGGVAFAACRYVCGVGAAVRLSLARLRTKC
ncbi:hypothetical protein K505DRAFT_53803 [Melanomma pulvis-pyrius CBS 109.77]|uniref:Uncharacterized protein n=1 Tax=Melanomma pulvis-pyrius CBS 109.77 TaxID=1314802 RepID=A0A6A6X8L5_9PLEO|nr:hypothetical protein K505DRAFT_53803 [Melanomma pulvis-pyrius CBS 109.77]